MSYKLLINAFLAASRKPGQEAAKPAVARPGTRAPAAAQAAAAGVGDDDEPGKEPSDG
jgi:hypothetical protein